MFEWNKPFQVVMKIKHNYISKYGFDTLNFETWLKKLNNLEYSNIFDCLQVNQKNEFLLIRYGIADMQESMWANPNSIYRECRSVVIDLDKEQLVLTPFKKFFNLNEIPENNIDKIIKEIELASIVEFTDKLDGSMQSVRYYNNDFFMAGSMALDINDSWRLADGYNMLLENYKQMIKENPSYTFIFEYISLKDAHVVIYDKEREGLYLIGIRNVYTGNELTYNEIKSYADKYNINMTRIENINIETVLQDMKKYKSNEKEGWVLNIDRHKIKIKCDDYVHLHRLLDKISSINVIIQNIAENRYDDLISKVPESYRDRVQKIAKKIFDYKNNTEQLINYYFKLAPKYNRKIFMLWVEEKVPIELKGYVRNMFLNKDINVLKNNANSYKKLKELGINEDYSALFSDMEDI
mgnify:CR=1 FL=1